MPSADTTIAPPAAGPGARFVVRSSLVMELVWAVFVKDDDSEREFPLRVGRFASAPGLEERIRAFWGDGEACFSEIFVVAERGGVLFERDPERLWAGLAEGLAAPNRFERLASETPEDQERFRGRLARLHDDPDLQAEWIGLLREVWSAVDSGWRTEGQEVAEAEAWEIRAKVPEVGTYADLVPLVGECDFSGRLPQLVSEAAAFGQDVVVVPTWLGRKGFLMSLTSTLLWGPPTATRAIGPSAEVRDRARRYKAMGDPTRLAIFEAAAHRPRSVGDLARALGVAQPTISNHVRILRDAGLLDQEKGGGRRLVADLSGFQQFQDEARRAVMPLPV